MKKFTVEELCAWEDLTKARSFSGALHDYDNAILKPVTYTKYITNM
jgi:hypothetical protein